MTATVHLTALRCCTESKMSLFLRNDVKFRNTSNNVEVIKILHDNFFDLKSLLNDIYYIPHIKIIKIIHVL